MLNACGQNTHTRKHTYHACTQVAYVRKCPRLLFHEEQEEGIEDEQRSRNQQSEDRQSPQHETNDWDINHSDEGAEAGPESSGSDTLDSSSDGTAGAPSSSERRNNEQTVENSSLHESSSRQHLPTPDQYVVRKGDKHSRYLVLSICPEIGLSKQDFKCAECRVSITFANSRICDYDGRYYCYSCHWNDTERTPARILRNWDHSPKPVSRRSLQIINFICRQPVIFDIASFNHMLYGLVADLSAVKVRFNVTAVI